MQLRRINHSFSRHPSLAVIYSFALADLVGALLLMLPVSHANSLSFIDALFTSTSAVCVTGLTVVNTGVEFTRAGQTVILLLIQLGGLGVMTFSMLFAMGLGRSLSFGSRLSLQENFLPHLVAEPGRLIATIFVFTVLSEGLIAFALFFLFLIHGIHLEDALFHAIFHAVSAFCNAGFSTFPNGLDRFMISTSVLSLLMVGILLGGMGFPIVYELWLHFRERQRRFSLHFKITLLVHLTLIAAGTIAFLWFERNGVMANLSYSNRLLEALFHSISARTAGFNTFEISKFSEHSIYVFLILMMIGACPGSTGGGIKTTTFAVLLHTAISRLHGFSQTIAFKRTIPAEQVNKAITLVFISIITVMLFHFLLTLSEPNTPFYLARHQFLASLFEVISALGTVGLTTGLTPHLSFWGKLCIILAMFVGRVGLLSLLSFLSEAGREPRPYRYVREKIMVG